MSDVESLPPHLFSPSSLPRQPSKAAMALISLDCDGEDRDLTVTALLGSVKLDALVRLIWQQRNGLVFFILGVFKLLFHTFISFFFGCKQIKYFLPGVLYFFHIPCY